MGDMSTFGSRLSLRSWPKVRDKSKVAPAAEIPPDSKFLDFENYRIRIVHKWKSDGNSGDLERADSPPERVTLFFIHGVGESADVWRNQANFFYEKGYEVVVPDLLGHGLSSKPRSSQPYLFENLAQDIVNVFDTFRGKRNVLIGHSYGTSFCVLLAKERSAQVSKVVLISGGGPTPLKPDTCSPFCCPLPVFHVMQPVIVKSYQRQAFHQPTNANLTDEKSFSLSSFVLRAVMRGQKWPEATEEYHADLIVPVLILQGQDDRFMSLEDAQWMNETIYGSDLEVISEAGHMVMIEQPHKVNELILNFLSRDPSTKVAVNSQRSALAPVDIAFVTSSHSRDELSPVASHAMSPASIRGSSRLSTIDSSVFSAKAKKSKVLL